jgi:hypothetical protein
VEVVNRSPFAADATLLADKDGRDLLVAVVKCAFALHGADAGRPAEAQLAVQAVDSYHGEPGESSVLHEGDWVPEKVGGDVVLIGHAYPPKGRATRMEVSVRVGDARLKAAVFGDRHWGKVLGVARISDPEAFEAMPLTYERAFGGRDESPKNPKHHEREGRNPVGRGLLARHTELDLEAVALPNLEDPDSLVAGPKDRPAPVGFGFYGRHWQPRAALAGTCDDAWLDSRSPLAPVDFDPRYHNGAHPHLTTARPFEGGEPVELVGVHRDGPLRLELPRLRPAVRVWLDDAWEPLEPRCDTVIVEPDEGRLTMVWRVSRVLNGRPDLVRQVEVAA